MTGAEIKRQIQQYNIRIKEICLINSEKIFIVQTDVNMTVNAKNAMFRLNRCLRQ